jgi:hypothetical protein
LSQLTLLPLLLLFCSCPWAVAAEREAGYMLLGSMYASEPLSQPILLPLLLLLLLLVLQLPLGCCGRA